MELYSHSLYFLTENAKVLHEDNDYQTSNNTCKLIFYMMSWSTPFYVVYVVLMPFYIPWTALQIALLTGTMHLKPPCTKRSKTNATIISACLFVFCLFKPLTVVSRLINNFSFTHPVSEQHLFIYSSTTR